MDERWTIKKRIPNVRDVQTANTQRLHGVPVSTLLHAQNFEHVQNKKLAPSLFSEPRRPSDEQLTNKTHVKRVTND